MASDWVQRSLGELTENFDSLRVPVKEADRRPGPYPYFGASGVVDYVDDFIFDGEYLLIAEDGENLRSRKTPIAFLANGRFWVNNHAHIVRGNDAADTRFLMYALSDIEVGGYLTGSTIPKLTQGNLNRIALPAPPLPEQRAIAHILGTLDDKIELNRRMSETLEGMARALFKSWFVDFDPVQAKMDGRWRPGESLPGLPAELYELFPDRLVESELGEVPEGWEVIRLGEMVSLGRQSVNPQDHPDEVFDHFSIPAFDDGRTPTPQPGAAIKSNKYSVSAGCVLVSKLNPWLKRVWLPAVPGERRSICSTEFLVVEPPQPQLRPWLYCLLASDSFQSRLVTLVTGTSGSHQRVRPRAFTSLKVLLPPRGVWARFGRETSILLERGEATRGESSALRALRNTLLPKLISGHLRIPDVERFVAGDVS